MGKPGKKVKTGGKHRSAKKSHSSTPKSPRTPRRELEYEEGEPAQEKRVLMSHKNADSDEAIFTLRDAARTTAFEPRSFAANLRHQKIGFVAASHASLNESSEVETPDGIKGQEPKPAEERSGIVSRHQATSSAGIKKVMISGLRSSSTERDLLKLAEKYGEVTWCEIVRNQRGDCIGSGKVTMREVQEAQTLRDQLDGEPYDGQILAVHYDSSKSTATSVSASVDEETSVDNKMMTLTATPNEPTAITSTTHPEVTSHESDSEGEVVFMGRNRQQTSTRSAPFSNDSHQSMHDTSPASVAQPVTASLTPTSRRPDLRKDAGRQEKTARSVVVPVAEDKVTVVRRSAFPIAESLFNNRNAVDIALEDYVSNVQIGGYESGASDREAPSEKPRDSENDWTGTDLDDFDDLSTSDADVHGIEEVLRKRQRPAGTQYLVVLKGQTTDDARWIHQDALNVDGAAEMIKKFENEEKLVQQLLDEDDGENDDDSEDSEEDFEDERDLYERKLSKMSDERLARLLTKQEELGMGSDELLLLDDLPDDDLETDEDFIAFQDEPPTKKRGKRRGAKVRSRGTGIHPLGDEEEELFGENPGIGSSHGGFDIMDMDRPSLKNARSRRALPDLSAVSDSDLETALRQTWEADRRKKKAKKIEREEMRAAGLLGGKGRQNKFKPDINVAGIDLEDLKIRLEAFMMDDEDQQLALPPMDKRDRKYIHEISSAFGLKSKSAGSGRGRFPVLYKTSKTPTDFDERLFARLSSYLDKRFLPRSDRRTTTYRGSGLRRGRGGGGRMAGTTYLEGETVGAGAAELGAGNRGHAMLEKMGWSKGMVLGALGNDRGILQPIEHVVKKSRTGLG